jgi:hypothetical protein
MPLNSSTGTPPTPTGPRRPPGSLREAVIADLGRRLSKKPYPASLKQDLERAIAGQSVQLHYAHIPAPWRPQERQTGLFELRGEELVPVRTWQPWMANPPAEWTVPVSLDHPGYVGDPRFKFG